MIINLPGQPKAIAETLEGIPSKGIHGIFAAVPYCIDLIGGPAIETRPNVVKAFRPKSAPQPHVIDAKIIEPKEGKADSTINSFPLLYKFQKGIRVNMHSMCTNAFFLVLLTEMDLHDAIR